MDILQGRKFLIVGAGLYGSVWAYKLAHELNEKVLVIDKRSHIGGNCYSFTDPESQAIVHQYGSHIFHTNDTKIWNFINQFTSFNNYRHRVLTKYKDKTYSMPINLQTINSFYQLNLNPSEAEALIRNVIKSAKISSPKNLEEKAISQIGPALYAAFIKGYTEKQWGRPPRDLPESIINRLPVRFNDNTLYFDDQFQGIPLEGYTPIFEKMLAHPNIEVRLNTDFTVFKKNIAPDVRVIYSGPIDQFFDYSCGQLSWRTLDFKSGIVPKDDFQGNSVMNYAEVSVPYTRIHEFKHYHPEKKYTTKKTFITYEYSREAKREDTPYYPVNTEEDKKILARYLELAQKLPQVIFGGRLGQYKYFDMHQVIGQALAHFENFKKIN